MTELPRFRLAELKGFAPEALEPKNRADAFMLALALAYNDLKDANWLLTILNDTPPNNQDEANAYNGQWAAMRDHGGRMIFGIMNEILKAIEAADDEGVFDDPTFKLVLAQLTRSARDKWQGIVTLAHGKDGSDPLKKYFVRVRNNVVSHYYDPTQLMRGYKHFFFDSDKTAFNRFACLCLGDTMGTTRFMFADAAVQAARLMIDPTSDMFNKSQQYMFDVNEVFRNLLAKYFSVKFNRIRRKRRRP